MHSDVSTVARPVNPLRTHIEGLRALTAAELSRLSSYGKRGVIESPTTLVWRSLFRESRDGRCSGLTDMLLTRARSRVLGFVVCRAEIAERRVTTVTVVETLDVIEDCARRKDPSYAQTLASAIFDHSSQPSWVGLQVIGENIAGPRLPRCAVPDVTADGRERHVLPGE